MLGIREFVAIIDPPQAAILAVGAVQDRPVVRDGALAVGKVMTVTMSCDHRVIDGSESVRFLVTVKEMIEDPARMLLEI